MSIWRSEKAIKIINIFLYGKVQEAEVIKCREEEAKGKCHNYH